MGCWYSRLLSIHNRNAGYASGARLAVEPCDGLRENPKKTGKNAVTYWFTGAASGKFPTYSHSKLAAWSAYERRQAAVV